MSLLVNWQRSVCKTASMGLLLEDAGGGGGGPQNACVATLDAALKLALKCCSTGTLWQPITSISIFNSSPNGTSNNKLPVQTFPHQI